MFMFMMDANSSAFCVGKAVLMEKVPVACRFESGEVYMVQIRGNESLFLKCYWSCEL